MKKASGILALVIITICFSCEEKGWFADCSDCTSTEPVSTNLKIKLENGAGIVRIRVYLGNLEDSVLYDYAEVQAPEYYPLVTLNKSYSVTATYMIDDKTYIAVDSATPKSKYTSDQCEEACYYVYDKVVDLRLKYLGK